MSKADLLQYSVLIGYFITLFLIGRFAARRIVDSRDYYVGGKKHGFLAVAFSARATGESAWLLLGMTGMGAFIGLSALWVVLGEVLGVGFAWFFMAKRFKLATDRYDSVTVPDFLASHFGGGRKGDAISRRIRAVAAGALVIFVTIYVSAQLDATGKAFEYFLNWNYYLGILVGFGVVLIYTISGGFVAVVWSDVLQGSLMLLGLCLLPLVAWASWPENLGVWSSLQSVTPGFTNIWGAGGFNLNNLLLAISLVAIGVGFLGSPQIFVRFIAIRDEREINKGRWVAIGFTLLADTGAVFAGMLGRYLLIGPEGNLATLGSGAENLLPLLVEHLFPITIVSLYIAAVLAAIMSTVDSLLVLASSAAVRDYYQKILHPQVEEQQLIWLSRRCTFIIALTALIIALSVAAISPDRTIFWFVIFGWSGIAATFCPAMLLSLFWQGCTGKGALAAMCIGFICVPFYKFIVPLLPVVGQHFAVVGELAPAVVTALVAGVLVSNLTREPS